MSTFFEKQVDRRSRQSMVSFLTHHFRYSTMSSWNQLSSYANCIKVHRLGLTSEQSAGAFELMSADDNSYMDELESYIGEFTAAHSDAYTIRANGRSGGYLVLYESVREDTGYKSRCRSCGQLNYKSVAQMPSDPDEAIIAAEILKTGFLWADAAYLGQSSIAALAIPDDRKLALIRRFRAVLKDCTSDNACGCCHATGDRGRENLFKPLTRLSVSGRGMDEDRDFSEWSMSRLRERVDLIVDFDRTCDLMRFEFIEMCLSCKVVEETIMVPKTVRRVVCAHAS